MADVPATPSLSLDVAPDGSLHFNGSVSPDAVKSVAAVNWLAILQALMTAAPQIIALVTQIINIFNPPPTPPTPPAH